MKNQKQSKTKSATVNDVWQVPKYASAIDVLEEFKKRRVN